MKSHDTQKDEMIEEIKKILKEVGEKQRELAEIQKKVEAERVKAEAERVKAEEERAKAEKERAKVEKERAKAEEERAKVEKERAKAEEERAKVEKERAKAEEERRAKEEEERAKAEEERRAKEEKVRIRVQEEIDSLSKEVKDVNKMLGKLIGGWGKFVEGIVEPACVKLANSLGIKIKQIHRRIEAFSQDEKIEADILILGNKNGKGNILVVEAKSHFEPNDMRDFLNWYLRFFEFFNEYRDYEVMGVVASPRFGNGVEKYAQREGLWVLSASEEVMKILNQKGFKPKILTS